MFDTSTYILNLILYVTIRSKSLTFNSVRLQLCYSLFLVGILEKWRTNNYLQDTAY